MTDIRRAIRDRCNRSLRQLAIATNIAERKPGIILPFLLITFTAGAVHAQSHGTFRIQISIGRKAPEPIPFEVHLVPAGGVKIAGQDLWRGTAGAGHFETADYTIQYPEAKVTPISSMQVIWAYHVAHSDANTIDRLMRDPAARPDPRRITFELNREGTRGFTLTIDQLLHQNAFWIPSLDVYLATGDKPFAFSTIEQELAKFTDARVLDQVERAPEATYSEFKAKWQDMGSPSYSHPAQQGPGHIVCITWDSAIHKFGIDRGAGVWSDYGNPDRFRFWFEFGNLSEGIIPYWKSQALQKDLPIITTVFVRDGIRYEVEQFAYPLNGPRRNAMAT